MMKVYVLGMDNGMEYEDNQSWVEAVYSSYRSASQYLIDKGFIPYTGRHYETNEYMICFEKEDEDTDVERQAWIIECEVKE